MITFLPYHNYFRTAEVLDYKRLGSQRLEAKQIYLTLTNQKGAWHTQNHPIIRMWRGYEDSLLEYGMAICTEWISRGYIDNQMYFFMNSFSEKYGSHSLRNDIPKPKWITKEFCLSHQSNLCRKYPEYYRKFFPKVPDDIKYLWPVS